MNSLRGSRPGFLQRFLLPRSQHEGFEIPKKTTTASFSGTHPERRHSELPNSAITPACCKYSRSRIIAFGLEYSKPNHPY
jgi:hypothetical protein